MVGYKLFPAREVLPPQWGPLPSCGSEDSGIGCRSLQRGVSVNPGMVEGSDLGGLG